MTTSHIFLQLGARAWACRTLDLARDGGVVSLAATTMALRISGDLPLFLKAKQ